MSPYIFSVFRPVKDLPDFSDPSEHGEKLERSTIRRGWLLVLILMLCFIALTKIFPGQTVRPVSPPPQMATESNSR